VALDTDKRLDSLEDSYRVLEDGTTKFHSYSDLDKVVTSIFDEIRAMRRRTEATLRVLKTIEDRVNLYIEQQKRIK